LAALATLLSTAIAGKKAPRAGQISPRAYNNASSNASTSVSLNILTETGVKNATAPYLYGWMFEDINHSGDGGLYGELLTNRAFDGSTVTWGVIPDFADSSIVYQENTCEAYGNITRPSLMNYAETFRTCHNGLQTCRKHLTTVG
jgi:alpha-N-arabinofuranosidase